LRPLLRSAASISPVSASLRAEDDDTTTQAHNLTTLGIFELGGLQG
jgi:hypothetical protein